MKKVLLTGATGFVGGYVSDALLQAGHEVTALVRTPEKATQLRDKGLNLAKGDVLDPDSIRAVCGDAQVVVHLVGIIREKPGAGFTEMHAQATENVVAAAGACGIERIVHMSALGTRPDAVSNYHKTKWRGEEAVRARGIPYVIFRPSVIFGPGDEFMTLLRSFYKNPFFVPVIGPGTSQMQPVYAGDVAHCFAAAVDCDGVTGQEYDLAGPQRYTVPQLLDVIGAHIGKRRMKMHMPIPIMRLVAAIMEAILPEPMITRDQLIMVQEDNVGDPEPAARDFEIHFNSLEQIIPRYL